MENLEITGKTVEEATKRALTQLNVGSDEVEITVITEGKSGILGLGAEEARIRVKLLKTEQPQDESINSIKAILEELLNKIGVKAAVQVDYRSPILDEEAAEKPVILNITGDDLGILIGRRGQTLDALQYLVRLIASRQGKSKTPVMLDVEGYKLRRYEDLRILAMNVAAQVKATKTSFRLEPMPAFERRIVHLTLANDPDIATESTGEGEFRKVVVIPKSRK
jgi:spoIIIJ-associated protein